jgi:hypothetical protein
LALIELMVIDMQDKSITAGDRATILSIYFMYGNMVSALISSFIGVGANVSIEIGFTACVAICIIACIFIFSYTKNGQVYLNFCSKV